MSQALYRKWRPRQWDQVIGQDHLVQTLHNAVKSGRVGHAYLFAGPRGTGKTTTARLLAKAVNCLDEDLGNRPCDQCAHCTAVNENRFLDLIEIDAASNTSVEDVRDLRDKINFSPSQGRFKVYIIDEVHMLSTAAFNALLKTLEEPPAHAIFILATTEIHKIPATVLSRCQRYEFRRVPVGLIAGLLRDKAKEENLSVDEEALLLIARQATGSFRDAISLLDQLTSTGQQVTLAEAQVVLGTATNEKVLGLIEAILSKDPAAGFQCIQSALDSGSDARQFARQVVEYLRGLLLVRMNNAGLIDATAEMRTQMANHAGRFDTSGLLEAIRAFNAAAADTRSSWQPGLGLELALAETVTEKPVTAAATQLAAQPAQRGAPLASASPAPTAPAVSAATPVSTPEAHKSAPQAEKVTQPGEPLPATSSGEGGQPFDLGQIRQSWSRIRQVVRQRSALTAAALNSCRTFTIKDGILVLGYQNDLLKSKMETEDNLALLKAALQGVLGVTMPVRCVVIGNKTTLEAEDLDIDSDGMVRTALDLGGEIVYKD